MLSKISVKKPYTVIVGVILAIVLGVIAFQKMSTDLLPSMNLPYVVVYTPYPGATPEQVESELTRPMEAACATLTDIKKLTSQSRDNVSVVVMQFNDGANMDTALIEISSRLDQLKGTWGDDVGAPVALKLNPDMLPVAILSVTRDDMDLLELSDYVEDELVPAFEGLNGVASASASGVVEQEIDVTIEQSRIDVVNSAILKSIDKELAKVEQELNDAQAQISDGKRQLARSKGQAYAQIDAAQAALAEGEDQISAALSMLSSQKKQLQAQRDDLAQKVEQMEVVMSLPDEQRAAIAKAASDLEALRQQKAELEAKLAALQDADSDTLLRQRLDAQSQRDELIAQRDAQLQYIEDLTLLDADALNAEIARLDQEIEAEEARLADARDELSELTARRDQLKAEVDDLTERLNGQSPADADATDEGPDASVTPGTDDTENPENSVTPGADDTENPEASVTPGADDSESPETHVTPGADDSDSPESASTPGTEDSEAPNSPATPGTDDTDAPDPQNSTAPEATDGAEPSENPDAPQDPSNGDSGTGSDGPEAPSESAGFQGTSGTDGGSEESASGKETAGESDTADSGSEGRQSAASEDKQSAPSEEKQTTHAEEKPAAPEREESRDSQADESPEETSESDTARTGRHAALAEDESREALEARLEAAKAELEQAEADVAAKSGEVSNQESELNAKKARREAKQSALDTLTDTSADVSARTVEAMQRVDGLNQRIMALDGEIALIDAQMAGEGNPAGEIAAMLSELDQQIAGIEDSELNDALALLADPEAMSNTYTQAKAGLEQIDDGLKMIDGALSMLSSATIPGGTFPGIDEDMTLDEAGEMLAKARSQMDSAFAQAASMLNEAEAELAKARKEFMDKREEAFKDAGLDGVITVQMVAGLIGAQNMSMPAGYVRDASNDQVLVRVGDKFGTIDELKRMKLFSLDLDTIDEVRLLDVAKVELADNRDEVFTKLDGRDGILLQLEKQSTFSTADVADTVMQKVKALQEEHPELHITDLMNQGEYIDIVVDSVIQNLIIGGGLAILILLLFLLDWRPTLTVAFSIPISVVVAFVAMYFSGITLNVLSLSGLALGIGMLVDNSIVSIENIYRMHDEDHIPPLRACVEGTSTVFGALLSSTLTTICVFLPIVFVQGMARDLFQDMGLTIAYSLLASLAVAMTVVPMMSSFLMRTAKPRKHRLFSKFQAAYAALLRGALRFKPLVLLAAVALLVFSGMQVTKMGISFMPEVNSRQMSANLDPDPEMSDAEQKAQATQIMADMLELDGIESIGLMDGSSSILASGGGYSYYINVDTNAGVKNADIVRQILAIGEKYDARLTAQASTMDISMMTGSGISVEITGDDIEVLQTIAKDIADIARATEGTADVDDGLEDAVPELRLVVDKEKVIDAGLTTGQVLQFVAQKLTDKVEVSKVTLDGKEMSIQLIEGRNLNLKPDDIQDLEIEVEKEEEDTMVRIGDVADVRDASSLSTINRASQRRMVSVSFDIADGYSANLVSNDFEARLKAYQLPDGYKAELAGENETVMDIMEDLVWMILVAILLIFLIMVAQFQSFKSPIIVMFTIPLAFTGGLLALILTHMDLSIVSMLGFLVLSGVVVNNGIVFIDCVNQLRIAGWEKREALVEAGRQRIRPILMTALTTILGMSTMALGHGTGAEMMQPMAVVSIGGLTYATLMTLFVVPVLYDLFNGKTMKAREIQMIKEAAGMNGDEVIFGDGAPASEPTPAAPAAEPSAPAGTPFMASAAEPTASAGTPEASPSGEVDTRSVTDEVPPPPEPETTTLSAPTPEAPPVPVFAAPVVSAVPAGKPITVRLGGKKKKR